MNHWLDAMLVTMLLLAATGYALWSLGPRALRQGLLRQGVRLMTRAPRRWAAGRIARRLEAAAAVNARSACGGCGSCASAPVTAAAPGTATSRSGTASMAAGAADARHLAAGVLGEVRIPVDRITRRR
jgi:hypothetical protein